MLYAEEILRLWKISNFDSVELPVSKIPELESSDNISILGLDWTPLIEGPGAKQLSGETTFGA